MLIHTHRPGTPHDEAGFTLIEVLVALVTGVIVMGALFTILEVSVRQSSRLTDVAQATQMGRITMTRIVDEAHSACLGPSFVPVQAGSTESKLIFVNGYSEKAEVPAVGTSGSTATGARKDEIVWDESKKTLTDNTFLGTEGSWPEYVNFAKTETPVGGTRVGEKITKAEVTNSKKEVETLPIFKYYKYAAAASTSTAAASSTLEEIPLTAGKKLTTEEAATVSSVLISFKTAPSNGKTELGRAANLSSQVTFAFSAPSSEAKISASPCE